jgi:hypothetical protein
MHSGTGYEISCKIRRTGVRPGQQSAIVPALQKDCAACAPPKAFFLIGKNVHGHNGKWLYNLETGLKWC